MEEIERLNAEAQALREQVAALRARVVVIPDFDNDVIIETFRRNGFLIELGALYSVKGQIAQLLNALDELARLNGKAVSMADISACLDAELREWTGDHRKAVERALTDANGRIMALLGEGKESGSHDR